jgi:hypothetical protein
VKPIKRHFIMPTFTGRRADLSAPTSSVICIEDIAHALSNDCRYGGHTKRFYSVAEHSVRLAYVVPAMSQAEALFHDASEAYLRDVPRQLRLMGMMDRYNQVQTMWQNEIRFKYGLKKMDPAMEAMDLAMVTAECKCAGLMNWESLAEIDTTQDPGLVSLGLQLYAKFKGPAWEQWGWPPAVAEARFMEAARDLLMDPDDRRKAERQY